MEPTQLFKIISDIVSNKNLKIHDIENALNFSLHKDIDSGVLSLNDAADDYVGSSESSSHPVCKANVTEYMHDKHEWGIVILHLRKDLNLLVKEIVDTEKYPIEDVSINSHTFASTIKFTISGSKVNFKINDDEDYPEKVVINIFKNN
ncbi:hypothetical protein [Hahella sp. HN01]|uniref:hypothetical protein n=1 Tax=Hahella sp. HN01 TaxID=2847262 RepID=UPI001C1F0BBC|nr:hypothetical protein [Hahella sp. HN01]MBU6952284.1 hypothetical protein [Hahella sp. HN01]